VAKLKAGAAPRNAGLPEGSGAVGGLASPEIFARGVGNGSPPPNLWVTPPRVVGRAVAVLGNKVSDGVLSNPKNVLEERDGPEARGQTEPSWAAEVWDGAWLRR